MNNLFLMEFDDGIVPKKMVFIKNQNMSCIVGNRSEVAFYNISASDNNGVRSVFLAMENFNILMERSEFQNNSASATSIGGVLSVLNSLLDVTDTVFLDNRSGRGGGAIAVLVGKLHLKRVLLSFLMHIYQMVSVAVIAENDFHP